MKATPGWSSDIFLIKTSHRSSSLSEWFWYPTLPVSVLSCSISWYYIISCSLCQSYYFQQPRQTHEWINFEHFWNYRYFYNDFMIIFFINQYWSSEKRLLNVIINKLFIHAFVLFQQPRYESCRSKNIMLEYRQKTESLCREPQWNNVICAPDRSMNFLKERTISREWK